MPKLDCVSDLHIDFMSDYAYNRFITSHFSTNKPDTILVIAGDIGQIDERYFQFLTSCSLRYKHVVFVLGNHECYDIGLDKAIQLVTEYTKTVNNVHLLHRNSISIDGIVFLGCILWTNIAEDEERDVVHCISDFRKIPDWSIYHHTKEHNLDRQWLDNMTTKHQHNSVIITHHVPCKSVLNSKYNDSLINSAFACTDMTHIITNSSLWICGHTHDRKIVKVKETRIICNPFGYPDENDNPYIMNIYI